MTMTTINAGTAESLARLLSRYPSRTEVLAPQGLPSWEPLEAMEPCAGLVGGDVASVSLRSAGADLGPLVDVVGLRAGVGEGVRGDRDGRARVVVCEVRRVGARVRRV